MCLFRNNNMYLYFASDTVTTFNVVFPAVLTAINQWVFVAMMDCAGIITYCQAKATDSAVTCNPYTLTNSNIAFGTSADSALFLSDTYYGAIVGEMLDNRYYIDLCLSYAEINSMFLKRKGMCKIGCALCDSVSKCNTCQSGYYLSVSDCLPCNSCCNTCNGPSNSDCLCCSSDCQLTLSSTCTRNF